MNLLPHLQVQLPNHPLRHNQHDQVPHQVQRRRRQPAGLVVDGTVSRHKGVPDAPPRRAGEVERYEERRVESEDEDGEHVARPVQAPVLGAVWDEDPDDLPEDRGFEEACQDDPDVDAAEAGLLFLLVVRMTDGC